MLKNIISSVCVLSMLALFGCKQGEGGFSQKFNAGLSRGDLLEVDIDTKALTYSYLVTEGDLKDLPEGKGSGKLIRDGKNVYLTDSNPPAFILAIENKVAVGVIGDDFYLGVPKNDKKFAMSEIAGVYNFVGYMPNGSFHDSRNTTVQGTVEFLQDGKGRVVLQANIDGATTDNSLAVKLVPQGDSIFSIITDDVKQVKLANFLPRQDGPNSIFAVLDFADANMLKGIGFAQKQRKLEENSLNGAYLAYETDSSEVTEGLVQGNSLILNNSIMNHAQATLKLNAPWTGVVYGKIDSVFEFFGIYSGKELYSILLPEDQRAQAFIAIKE